MSRSLVLSIGLVSALAGQAWAQGQPPPVTPRGPQPVPEGAVPPAEKETGRAPPPRVLPAEEPAVLRPSPATPGQTGSAGTPGQGSAAGAGAGAAGAATPSGEASEAGEHKDETRVEPAASGPPAAPAKEQAPRFSWEPFGYLRAQLVAMREDQDVAFVGRSDGFSLQNARLGVRGAIGTTARFEVSLDGAVDERERVNVPNGRLRVGLRDAFVELNDVISSKQLAVLPVALSLRVGRFEAWFDPDGYDGDTERMFVDRALESHGVSATEGWETSGLAPGRSIGVALRARIWPKQPREADGSDDSSGSDSGVRLLGEATMMNGADEFASGNDNDALALAGALRLVVPGRAWAQAAYRHNPRTEGDLPFQQEEVDTAYSLGGGVQLGPVKLAAGGVLQYTRFETTGGPRQRAWGAHGQAMVRVLDGEVPLDVGYRFAAMDPSSLVVTDRLMEHTAGLVLSFSALPARLQLNATHAVEQEARQLTNDRAELVLEVRL